jgi:integrase
MTKRRSRGEGSIFQRPDALWVAQITMPDGKRKVKYSKLQKPVRDWLQTQRNELREGTWAKDDTLTVAGFFDRFLNDTLKFKVKANTFESYSDIVRLHIKPALGKIRLINLRPYHLPELYKQKIESGLSNRSVQYIHAVIHRRLNQAYKWGIVSRNVADLVVAPRPQKKEMKVFNPQECRLFLDAVKNDRLYSLYAVAIGCGLRLGELLALNWEDVDFENSTVSIKRALQKVKNKNIIGEPKSDKARRLVSLPSFVLEALKKNRGTGLMFATRNGTYFSHRNIDRHFRGILVKSGLPKIRFHDLRHTFASIMLSQNVHPKTVQEALGHSSIVLTMDTYSHVMPGMQKEAASKLDLILGVA